MSWIAALEVADSIDATPLGIYAALQTVPNNAVTGANAADAERYVRKNQPGRAPGKDSAVTHRKPIHCRPRAVLPYSYPEPSKPVSVVLYRRLPATGSAVTDAIPFPPSSTGAKSDPRRKGNNGTVGQSPARYSNLMH